MTLLMVIGSSNVGGAEKQFVRLAKELSAQIPITILVIGKLGPYRKTYKDLGLPYIESSGGLFSDVFTIGIAIWRFRPHALLLWLYRANVIGSIIGKFFRVSNIIITARNTDWPNNTYTKRLLLKVSSTLASCIVANSTRAANFHQSIGFPGKKIQVIRNFINPPAEIKTHDAREISVFGIAARAVEGKGHFLAIDALNQVSKFFPNIKLSIIGFGIREWTVLRDKLQNVSFEFELLEGTLDLSTWFSQIDLCLAFSDAWDSDSNVVLEAICNQVPVICSERQSIEDLGNSLLVVEPWNLESISSSIIFVMETGAAKLTFQTKQNYLELQKLRNSQQLLFQWILALQVSRDR